MSGIFQLKDLRHALRRLSSRLFMAVSTPSEPGKRPPWWIIAAALVGVLVIGTLGGVWGYRQVQKSQALTALTNFCTDLQGAQFDRAYKRLSGSLQNDFPRGGSKQFAASIQQLENQLGTFQGCSAPPNGYNPVIQSDGTIRVEVNMSWSSILKDGGVRLKVEDGHWKVDEVEETLLTVNLGALALAVAYCTAFQGLDFGNAYQMLDPNALHSILPLTMSLPPAVTPQEAFARLGIFHYFFDGEIVSCGLSGIPLHNTNHLSDVILVISPANRSSFHERVFMCTFEKGACSKSGSNWIIDDIERPDPNDPNPTDPTTFLPGDPQGTDVQPLLIGQQLCDAVHTGTPDAIKTFAQTSFLDSTSAASFVTSLTSGNLTYAGCYPDLETYKVDPTDSMASFTLAINVINMPSTPCVHVPLTFQKNQQGSWRVKSALVKDCTSA